VQKFNTFTGISNMRVACDTIKFLQKKLDSNPTEEFSTKITQELKIMKENSYIDKMKISEIKN
jgi:hypothetical protein